MKLIDATLVTGAGQSHEPHGHEQPGHEHEEHEHHDHLAHGDEGTRR